MYNSPPDRKIEKNFFFFFKEWKELRNKRRLEGVCCGARMKGLTVKLIMAAAVMLVITVFRSPTQGLRSNPVGMVHFSTETTSVIDLEENELERKVG